MAGEIEGRGIVDGERLRLVGRKALVERADQAAEEIVGAAVRQPFVDDGR